MRFLSLPGLLLAGICFFCLQSCSKQTEELNVEPIADYLPLTVGKYITYRVDSTVFTSFGRTTEVHSYQVKHLVDAQVMDNMGRPSFRIYRYIRDLAGTQGWSPSGTYLITPVGDRFEVIEDNLRFVRLRAPIKEGFFWRGNSFLPDNPYGSLYNFSNDDFMWSWDYTYETLNGTFKYNQQLLDNVVEVVHIDERMLLDTLDVFNNAANVPKNAKAVYLRGTATDTIRLNTVAPDFGNEKMNIYNQSNYIATLNGIKIPSGLGLDFQYAASRWYYTNSLTVSAANKVIVPRVAYTAFILGPSTGTITADVAQIDTFSVKKINIYNKSNNDAFANFNAAMNLIPIPPQLGRSYELRDGAWRLYNNNPTPLDKDPFIEGLAYGSTDYSIEKYAKNIGLVYKECTLWEYQPAGASTTGFGIKMQMIDHN